MSKTEPTALAAGNTPPATDKTAKPTALAAGNTPPATDNTAESTALAAGNTPLATDNTAEPTALAAGDTPKTNKQATPGAIAFRSEDIATSPAISTTPVYPIVRLRDIVGVLLCMVLARSAAMAFNRWIDHRIDAANPRTASRHIPAGLLSRRSVLAFTVMCCLGFVGCTLLFLPNRIPLLAAGPVLFWLLAYSLAKRFTAAAHLWLGIALALSPVCVWVAIRGEGILNSASDFWLPGWLAATVALWVAGFDIIYACQDADFDKSSGLQSIPAWLGVPGALRLAAGLHVVMLACLVTLALTGDPAGLSWIFAISVAATACLVISQHRLVRPDDLTRVNQAFFHANALISVILLVGGVIDCYF
ncbi:MAG: 4-hydroxybenzoate octaprenyltransferase [Planctomycetota bacterium]